MYRHTCLPYQVIGVLTARVACVERSHMLSFSLFLARSLSLSLCHVFVHPILFEPIAGIANNKIARNYHTKITRRSHRCGIICIVQ